MRKLLICCLITVTLAAVGCSSKGQREQPPKEKTPFLERWSWVHKPEIQQGNIINQEIINKLRPGMDKRQVRFVMGTPLLVDVFHQNRWDFYYSMKSGHEPLDTQQLILYFDDNRLVRIDGDLRPEPSQELEGSSDQVIDVPDYEPEHKGIITRVIDFLRGR